MLDELAHAGPEHLDPGFVAGFDRKQGRPDPSEDLALLDGHTVVDLGAGTGRFAMAAAKRFDRVVAVDVSPAMLAVIRSAGLPNVECVQAGFLTYEHRGEPADAVFTRHALHQLPDFWKAIALHRIAGMLRPGGLLRLRDLIYDFQPGETETVLRDWFDQAVTDPEVGYTRDDLAEHVRTEHSTFRWLLEPMLDAAGFEVLDVQFTGRVYGAYTCQKRV
ncbi:ubiquinone/menaquinone biosynthesis C-methylase UbiE [Amycolatopsis thermoflava]|uniref:Ubiquinone/menaquinone biosynthesis C-methylase UbiE n=2 Tax=Amycolatopsis thermoflava TaxID=84480 RepID=A0A3N2GVY3_9PSEU|nr:ubiquinone/menaquinone biosynthesis C-methylase UbiE [Amycolatopsis thermoflava]